MKTRQIPRRTFLRGVVPLPLILTAAARPSVPRRVKFGLVSDVHQDVMPDGLDRIRRFVTAMQEAGADFILQLGDFCWPHPRNKAFLAAWNVFAGARYHVLGNHDMDGGYNREQTVAYYGAPGRYYMFAAGPLRGIVLDSNDPGGNSRGYRPAGRAKARPDCSARRLERGFQAPRGAAGSGTVASCRNPPRVIQQGWVLFWARSGDWSVPMERDFTPRSTSPCRHC